MEKKSDQYWTRVNLRWKGGQLNGPAPKIISQAGTYSFKTPPVKPNSSVFLVLLVNLVTQNLVGAGFGVPNLKSLSLFSIVMLRLGEF